MEVNMLKNTGSSNGTEMTIFDCYDAGKSIIFYFFLTIPPQIAIVISEFTPWTVAFFIHQNIHLIATIFSSGYTFLMLKKVKFRARKDRSMFPFYHYYAVALRHSLFTLVYMRWYKSTRDTLYICYWRIKEELHCTVQYPHLHPIQKYDSYCFH